ncbi:helix-turn-helix domain-containing protein [Mycoplasma phocimorsus]
MTKAERFFIQNLLKNNMSIRAIARQIKKSPSIASR